MKRFLHQFSDTVEIVHWYEAGPNGRYREFVDLHFARQFLQDLADDPFNLQVLRKIAADMFQGQDVSRWTDQHLIDHLAPLLVSGRLKVAVIHPWTPGIDSGGADAAAEEPQKEQPPAEIPEELDWIEVVLKDRDGQVLAGERYTLDLSDGRTLSGTLDSEGKIRVDGIPPGMCRVRFPDLHINPIHPE